MQRYCLRCKCPKQLCFAHCLGQCQPNLVRTTPARVLQLQKFDQVVGDHLPQNLAQILAMQAPQLHPTRRLGEVRRLGGRQEAEERAARRLAFSSAFSSFNYSCRCCVARGGRWDK